MIFVSYLTDQRKNEISEEIEKYCNETLIPTLSSSPFYPSFDGSFIFDFGYESEEYAPWKKIDLLNPPLSPSLKLVILNILPYETKQDCYLFDWETDQQILLANNDNPSRSLPFRSVPPPVLDNNANNINIINNNNGDNNNENNGDKEKEKKINNHYRNFAHLMESSPYIEMNEGKGQGPKVMWGDSLSLLSPSPSADSSCVIL